MSDAAANKQFRLLTIEDLENISPRRCRGDDPIEYDNTPIRVRGDALDRILWRGRQWAVIDYGLESLDGIYQIEKKRLAEHVEVYGWPLHITQKNWADSDDFCTAWLVALALHGTGIAKKHVREAISKSYPAELRRSGGRGAQ